jgi:cysteinyl-tRNA synthetase
MTIRFHNTLKRATEAFEPLRAGEVGIYACGPTVYQLPHIGNYRTFLFNDLLHRWLAWKGFRVRMIMNVTDVDDRIIDLAAERGVPIGEYTAPHADAFFEELETLGARPAHAYPRATDHIDAMVSLVERLVERGHAYQADGSVYYDIGSFEGYGKLSRIPLDDVRTGERVSSDRYEKQDARDFALWKAARDVDRQVGAAWPSPWGEGRPGWHLECSAMSMAELGPTLDIHTGGEDLVFPHHEDEIAQSEGATGKPFARYWVHVKHLLVGGRKMSKSLSNFLVLRDLLEERYEPAAIRHQLLSAHYRSELNFTLDGLDASSNAVQKLLNFESRIEDLTVAADAPSAGLPELAQRALADFRAALDDDLNTANALAALFTLVGQGNAALDRAGAVPPRERDAVRDALASIDKVLGLLEVARMSRALDTATVAWVDRMVGERQAARKGRDFARADEIRKELAAKGIVLEDSAQGTRWKVVRRVEEAGSRG